MRSFKIFNCIVLMLCLIPALFMPIRPSKAAANEILSPAPSWGKDMLKEAMEYVNDHFAFRQEMATAWAAINAFCFHTSAEEQVIYGKGGELYYAADLESSLTEQQLRRIAGTVAELQKQVEAQGAEFIFTIAPDKSSLHGGNLPETLKSPGAGKALEPYLEELGVRYISLFDPEIPYFRTDSHWTSYGAALACDALLGTSFAGRDFSQITLHTGDLYEMLYPASGFQEEDRVCPLSYEVQGNPNGGNAMTIRTTGQGEKTLFCWRDSFGVSLYPYLAEGSRNAVFSRSNRYDAADAEGAEIVILEIVERNLKTFL